MFSGKNFHLSGCRCQRVRTLQIHVRELTWGALLHSGRSFGVGNEQKKIISLGGLTGKTGDHDPRLHRLLQLLHQT